MYRKKFYFIYMIIDLNVVLITLPSFYVIFVWKEQQEKSIITIRQQIHRKSLQKIWLVSLAVLILFPAA